MAKKRTKSRYILREQVGAGDFAKVFAAEDTKLGRKVAIKQLHSQYIDDDEKLERYWQEAQLLVDLEHPNIMTIYDLVKSRGSLVLELMKGSLNQIYADKPMPVQDVRQTLLQAAKGLECLHKNHIIHGDIKPGNLMLSRQDVVKLGDFGLARRVNDAEGSLLKGTTKYMAPELVSEEFGDVGPASDLYSLGFAALELMIGPEFDSLFPDLVAFGRDKQMAWMMWHCSADRKLPPIQSILEGVPSDLANVLQKLTAKDQASRYKTAKELIADLSGGAKPVGESLKDEAAAAAELARKRKKKRRLLALAASVASILISLSIFYFTREKPAPPVAVAPPSVRGVVQNVLPHDRKFVIDLGTDWKEFTLRSNDDVILNRKKRQLRDLQLGDRVVVHTILNEEGRSHRQYVAFRPETHIGAISEVNLDEGKFMLSVEDGEDAGQQFELIVADETLISLNKKKDLDGLPLGLPNLQADDQVVVKLSDDENGMLALEVDAIRLVQLEGVVRKLDPRRGTITIAAATDSDQDQLVTLPIDAKCVFTLNGLATVNQKLLAADNLQVGDRVSIQHDVKIKTIGAYRAFEDKGRIIEIAYADNQFTLKSQNATAPQQYRIDSKTQVLLGEDLVLIDELRMGDTVQLVHESPDDDAPTLLSLNAIRPPNRKKWAILIANQQFNSSSVPPLSTSIVDANSIREQMIKRFGVPENQVSFFEDEGRVRLQSAIPNLIRRIPAGSELYVYVATRGYNAKDRNAFLATKDFSIDEMDETGIGLDWLIDQLDSVEAKKKLLMLDCCPGDTARGGISGAEMLEIVKQNQRGGYPRSTYVLAGCIAGQHPLASTTSPGHGLFGESLSDAFSGNADQQRDNQVEITELTKFVSARVTSLAGSQNGKQTPRLILPDDRPPRLSDRAQDSIIDLLSLFSQKKLDSAEIMSSMSAAQRLANDEPEPTLAGGLLLIKAGKINNALEILENLRLANRNALLAHQSVIWIHFYKKHYDLGTTKIREMLQEIPKPEKKDETYSEQDLRRFEWAGRLRELAGSAQWSSRVPADNELAECDRAVNSHGELPTQRYAAGRKHVKEIIAEFDKELKNDPKSDAVLNRQRIQYYVPPIARPETIEEIRRGLDK